MNGTRDSNETATADANDGELGPQEAAQIIEQTRRQARRQFNPNPPLLTLLIAILVLVAYGSLWLSVLGQHPYKGPQGWALAILYSMVAIVVVLAVTALRRANAGVGRKNPAQSRATVVVIAAAWIAVYLYMGALRFDGASHAIVYGVYPATAPLMIVGLVGAAVTAMREDWPVFAGALVAACVAAIAAFTGPIAAWLVMGIGLFLAIMASAVVRAVRQRA
jgi:hypothetical protein